MRHGLVFACLIACTSTTPTPTETLKPSDPAITTPPPTPTPAVSNDWRSDPDGDRYLGVCDRCPDQKETDNSINNDDGCPETDEEIKLAATDPRTRYARPLFKSDLNGSIDSWVFDDEIEALACIGTDRVSDEKAKEYAAKLCTAVEKSIREHKQKIATEQHSRVGYEEGYQLVVLSAAKMKVWRWGEKDLVRASPPPVGLPMVEGCTFASFEPGRTDRVCLTCSWDKWAYLAQWPNGKPVYPE